LEPKAVKFFAIVLSLFAGSAIAGDCFQSARVVQKFAVAPAYRVQQVQKFQKVQQVQQAYGYQQFAAVQSYQYHAPVLFSVGSHYRASRAESVDASDLELLKRFRAYLEAEKSIAQSVSAGVLADKCAGCHNATKSGGGFVFDGSIPIDHAAKSAIMRAALSGSMPPSAPLESDDLSALADQLFLESW
jgi:hypothetical protein